MRGYDVIVVGGGIVGLSTAWQLLERHPRLKLLLLDKADRLAAHQSGHNSGVIHAGVYYRPGSLKARFCREGHRATKALCAAHGIPFVECGKLLVATDAIEVTRLRQLWERIGANGLEREWLDAAALSAREPAVRGLAAVRVPASAIVDYRQVCAVMAERLAALGGEIRLGCEVRALEERAEAVIVESPAGCWQTRRLVACAGLQADRLVRLLGIEPGFRICPFRGEYYRLAARRQGLVSHLIYPVPDPALPFLGVHLTRTIDGGITAGPNAVLALAREGYRKRDVSLRDLIDMAGYPGIRRMLRRHLRAGWDELQHSLCKRGYLALLRKYCPTLELDDLEPHPAGVRAQAVAADGSLVEDFLFVETPRTLHVGNAPSPAATAAIPIGRHIAERLAERDRLT